MIRIKVLGPGCPKCKAMANNAEAAAKKLGVEYELVKILNIEEIADYGVMITPALIIDGEVKIVGKIPTIEEIGNLIS